MISEDIWDAMALSSFVPTLVYNEVHCPVMGAQEGSSPAANLTNKVTGLLVDAQPVFLPAGQVTAQRVTSGTQVDLWALFSARSM